MNRKRTRVLFCCSASPPPPPPAKGLVIVSPPPPPGNIRCFLQSHGYCTWLVHNKYLIIQDFFCDLAFLNFHMHTTYFALKFTFLEIPTVTAFFQNCMDCSTIKSSKFTAHVQVKKPTSQKILCHSFVGLCIYTRSCSTRANTGQTYL